MQQQEWTGGVRTFGDPVGHQARTPLHGAVPGGRDTDLGKQFSHDVDNLGLTTSSIGPIVG